MSTSSNLPAIFDFSSLVSLFSPESKPAVDMSTVNRIVADDTWVVIPSDDNMIVQVCDGVMMTGANLKEICLNATTVMARGFAANVDMLEMGYYLVPAGVFIKRSRGLTQYIDETRGVGSFVKRNTLDGDNVIIPCRFWAMWGMISPEGVLQSMTLTVKTSFPSCLTIYSEWAKIVQKVGHPKNIKWEIGDIDYQDGTKRASVISMFDGERRTALVRKK